MTHTPHGRSLQALILDKKGDRSYERVSRDCGGTPTRNALQKLATSPTKAFPDKATLLGLQRGLPASIDELLAACAISMGLRNDSESPAHLVIRGAGALPTSSQQLLISLSAEMQRLSQERDGDDDAAPITHAGESPATDPERRERSSDDSSLAGVVPGKVSSEQSAVGDSSIAEMLPHEDHEQYPAAGIHEDELSRWRREREATPTVVAGSDTEEVPGQEEIPVPDEALMAGYDEPQESILARDQQDEAAERSQADYEDDHR